MKTLTLLILSSLIAAGAASAQVEVTFQEPEQFRDIDYGDGNTRRGIKVHIPILEKHIIKFGKRFLKEGQTLTMTVTDVDLAGDYEPWLSPDFDDIRIVKDIYPPRISFSYELKDAEGKVLKSGEENLVDMNFQYRMRVRTHDELFYDKEMITDWMRRITK
ncbi:DUF3016 domain-containing protein [Opitutia bacterium ISCC 51]|nr:DUF3016 domain-containing protein [Opitutae bacterium ISCC 51]QXD29011.1 DUF3016 domain-containing protein [Opitutae bacterium ISCC 52]